MASLFYPLSFCGCSSASASLSIIGCGRCSRCGQSGKASSILGDTFVVDADAAAFEPRAATHHFSHALSSLHRGNWTNNIWNWFKEAFRQVIGPVAAADAVTAAAAGGGSLEKVLTMIRSK